MKINKIIVFILVSFLFICKVSAESIDEINLNIYIDDNGNAHIKEIWKGNFDKNTELYHPFFNLGNSNITMESVSDDLDNNYEINNNWNIHSTFNEKAKRFGIYRDGDEVDICWGITEYGERTYTVDYSISNFIYNTTDGYQILFWQLIPYDFSSSIQDAYIRVYSDFKYDSSWDMWGYGDKGAIALIHNGFIEMISNGALSKDEYMTMLVKFPKDTFNTNNKINKSWEQIFTTAEIGAEPYSVKDNITPPPNENNDNNNSNMNQSVNNNNPEIVDTTNNNSNNNILFISIIITLLIIIVTLLIIILKKMTNKN